MLPIIGKCQCSDGDARLIQQETDYLCGRLEVCHSGVWGTVCDNGMDINVAQAACQQLSAGNGTCLIILQLLYIYHDITFRTLLGITVYQI